jgi:hypothetical protein
MSAGLIETILTGVILLAAVAWAARRLWRTARARLGLAGGEMRRGAGPAGGCGASPGGCACSRCPTSGSATAPPCRDDLADRS